MTGLTYRGLRASRNNPQPAPLRALWATSDNIRYVKSRIYENVQWMANIKAVWSVVKSRGAWCSLGGFRGEKRRFGSGLGPRFIRIPGGAGVIRVLSVIRIFETHIGDTSNG